MNLQRTAPNELSVVIPTLGGDTLLPTIISLNSGDRNPAEILICIPEDEAHRVETIKFKNTKVVKTRIRGQVGQRLAGLRLASQQFVMQIDDDILLPPSELKKIYKSINILGKGNAVAPLLRHSDGRNYITVVPFGASGFVPNLIHYLICGSRWGASKMGTISPSGFGHGIDPRRCSAGLFETEWLPGGCVLCHAEDLVLDDYYPLPGKAYTEDLVHSILWRRNGIRLWILTSACAYTKVNDAPLCWQSFINIARSHLYVVRSMDGKTWRFLIWQILSLMRYSPILFKQWFFSRVLPDNRKGE